MLKQMDGDGKVDHPMADPERAKEIIASFAVTGVGIIWLLISSYLAMRRAEASADELRQQP